MEKNLTFHGSVKLAGKVVDLATDKPVAGMELRMLIETGQRYLDTKPVVADENGDLQGVAAVIDKDLASAMLANELDADMLLISTAVEKVALHWGTPEQRWIDEMTLADVKRYLDEGIHFAEGSMAPKMRAVVSFLEGGGGSVLITNPESIERAVAGETGTRIVS